MNTTTLEEPLPALIEEFGPEKKVDVILTHVSSEFDKGIPESDLSGLFFEKSGLMKAKINLAAKITVEKEAGSKKFEPVRDMYLTLQVKAKAKTDNKDKSKKIFSILPRSAEVVQMKLFEIQDSNSKEEPEELMTEATTLQSYLNLGLVELTKPFIKEHGVDTFRGIPPANKYSHCLGIALTDFDLIFQKS